MKLVIQRCSRASVSVDGQTVGSIGKGLMVLVGIGHEDNEHTADVFVRKMLGLRIFEDKNGKTNLALKDVDGELLLVSQFTLYAACRKGNRPGFTDAADPDRGCRIFDYFTEKCREQAAHVDTGIFGADMKVELINDGPFTIILDESQVNLS